MKRMLPWLLLVAFIVSVNCFADSDSAALFKSKCAMCHGPDGTGSAMYRSVQEAIAPELPKGAQRLARAHLLLRTHGKTICRDKQPACHECPVEDACAFRNPGASKGPRNIPGSDRKSTRLNSSHLGISY